MVSPDPDWISAGKKLYPIIVPRHFVLFCTKFRKNEKIKTISVALNTRGFHGDHAPRLPSGGWPDPIMPRTDINRGRVLVKSLLYFI